MGLAVAPAGLGSQPLPAAPFVALARSELRGMVGLTTQEGARMTDGPAPAEVMSLAGSRAPEFEEFVRTETAGLLRSAYLLTGNAASAEDVVQETLTRLYPRWSKVQNASYPLAYVRRSVINTYLNSVRSKSSRELVVEDVGDRPSSVDLAEMVTDRDLVWNLLGQLGERQRTALVLRYFHDWDDREIARAVGCRTGTVRSLISRGLAVLRADDRLGDAHA
jgi:RNA polymerase sigma-70 factor (sigma-E family)